ncbi:hypothetical protein IFM89_021873 [Coptis chinensis]|uniref:Cytochrome P450 n=1 Tax=Coptis chinensis TaxID=261450 RepID=A0A835LJD8_9MAGN|nr:hypothetical protein IFM89_021873 [Coptis chinensis]
MMSSPGVSGSPATITSPTGAEGSQTLKSPSSNASDSVQVVVPPPSFSYGMVPKALTASAISQEASSTHATGSNAAIQPQLPFQAQATGPSFSYNIVTNNESQIHQSRGGQSLYPFSPEMNMVPTQLHPSQQGLVQVGMSGTENPSDALRRTINPQLMAMNGAGYKDSNQFLYSMLFQAMFLPSPEDLNKMVRLGDTEWCIPFEIMKEDTFFVVLRKQNGARRFLKTEIRGYEEGSRFLVVFRLRSEDGPVRGSNSTWLSTLYFSSRNCSNDSHHSSPINGRIRSLVIVWMTNYAYKWKNPISNGKLPPGSMGLPLLGETIQFFKSQTTFDIRPFIKERMTRYGPLFKTNLVGWPVVVSTDPEFSHFIFQQEGNSVELWYLDSFMKLIGQQSLTSNTGAIHKYLRNMIMDHFGPEKQKEKLLSDMENMARENLSIWAEQESVEVKEAATTDQKRAIRILKEMVKERFYSDKKHGDFLDVVIEEMKKDAPLFNVESAAYFVFTVLFASFETVSLAITLAIKFLSEHPSVLKDLTDEHEEILKKRENVDSPLTWNEYKSMTFTSHVIDETLRLGNIAPLVFRRATRDIQIDGYTIPAGWTIMVCPPALHLNPEKYEDTLAFNPWRWMGQGSNTASKNFMAFGGGMRLCAGAEFAKLQMSVVLHFLVTKYRWTKIKGGEVVKTPGILFPNGLHIKVTEKI